MPSLRTLVHLLLILSLLAGGLAAGVSDAAPGPAEVATAPPCHEPAPDATEPAPASCCEDSACTCGCINTVPAGVLAATRLPHLRPAVSDVRTSTSALPVTRADPETRPPIA